MFEQSLLMLQANYSEAQEITSFPTACLICFSGHHNNLIVQRTILACSTVEMQVKVVYLSLYYSDLEERKNYGFEVHQFLR